jgi:hypothetical protein
MAATHSAATPGITVNPPDLSGRQAARRAGSGS